MAAFTNHSLKDHLNLPTSESWDLKKPLFLGAGPEFVPARELFLGVGGPGAWLPSGIGSECADLFPPHASLSLSFTLSLLLSYLT